MGLKMAKFSVRVVFFLLLACAFMCGAVSLVGVATGWIPSPIEVPSLAEPPAIDVDGDGEPDIADIPDIPGVGADRFFELPEIPDTLRPGESVMLAEEFEPRPLVQEIPAPQQVATAPSVLGANVFFTLLLAIIFGICITVLDNMLAEEEWRIQTWLRAYGIDTVVERLKSVFRWGTARGVRQGLLTLPLVALILAMYGIIFALLEGESSLLSREGALLAITMAFSVGIVSFSGDVVRRIFGRIWGEQSRFNLYPISLLIALATVGFSRVLALTPGIAFGVPGGAEVDMPPDKREARERVLSIATLVSLVVIAGVGWLLSGLILRGTIVPLEERLAEQAAVIASGLYNVSLIVFLVGIETAFFESMPVAYTSGRRLFKGSKILWALFFIPVTFLFMHTLLNPQSDFLASFSTPNVQLLWAILIGLVGLTSFLWVYFNVIDDALQRWVGLQRR